MPREIPVLFLATQRLQFEGLTPQDIAQLFTNFTKEEVMVRLGHRSETEYLQEKYKSDNGYASYNKQFILFLLRDKTSGNIIGRCGIHNWDKNHRRAEIGYHLADEEFKRKGLMSEAVDAVIRYGFTEMKLHRLEAYVSSKNIASIKTLEKHHFVREGLLKEHYLVEGIFEDSIAYALLEGRFHQFF